MCIRAYVGLNSPRNVERPLSSALRCAVVRHVALLCPAAATCPVQVPPSLVSRVLPLIKKKRTALSAHPHTLWPRRSLSQSRHPTLETLSRQNCVDNCVDSQLSTDYNMTTGLLPSSRLLSPHASSLGACPARGCHGAALQKTAISFLSLRSTRMAHTHYRNICIPTSIVRCSSGTFMSLEREVECSRSEVGVSQ